MQPKITYRYNRLSPGQQPERVSDLRVEAPGRAPKEWWNKMEKDVRKNNPDYSDEQVRKTIGDIWHNKLSQYRKDKLLKKYESALRVSAIQHRVETKRVMGERVCATEIEASNFPNLFSSDTRKWIELQTRNLAANMGPISSPEQAVAFVNDAAQQVMEQISDAINDEVTKIVEGEKDNILKELVTEDTTFEEEVMAPPAAPQIPMEMTEAPAPSPEAMAASKKAYMPHKLKIAFEKSANPAEQALSLIKLDPTFLAHLEELEEQAESVERLAEFLKDYVIGRGLLDESSADTADWVSPTKQLTSARHG